MEKIGNYISVVQIIENKQKNMDAGLICEELQKKTGKYWGFVSENEFVSSDLPFTEPRTAEKYTREQVLDLLKSFEK